MNINKAEFMTSAVKTEQFPNTMLPEIVLSGRSNVGKSSFINSMVRRNGLAHTSSRPGKTQTLNFFNIDDRMIFVDVPGYGYAKVSKKQREEFGAMIENYFETRKQIKLAVLLVDFRHEPSEDDVIMYNFLKYYDIPTIVVATKVDKVNRSQHQKHTKVIKQALEFELSDKFVMYSAETLLGKEEAWKYINELVKR